MLAMREFRSHLKGLPDLLNWAAVIAPGVVLNKDGSFTTAYFFRGNDLSSSTYQELTALSAHANAALVKLGTGWLINVDCIRVEATTYPEASRSFFPDPTTLVIDAERRAQHEQEGAHYENVYAFALTYQVPPELHNKVAALFVDEGTNGVKVSQSMNYSRLLERFQATVKDIVGAFSAGLQMRHMTSDELLTYLNRCLTGLKHPVKTPDVPMYLDAVLGNKDFYTGLAPKIGRMHVRVVAIKGYPGRSMPGIVDQLNRLPFEYRWSTRFIALDQRDAEKKLGIFRRNWFQKRHGLVGLVKGAAGGGEQTFANGDAVAMAMDANNAVTENSAGEVRYGYLTNVIVIMSEKTSRDANGHLIYEVDEHAAEVEKLLGNSGFPCIVESMNAVDAFMGSLPAHGYPNVRRPMLHTLNLADLLPLTAVWSGSEFNPCPFYPPKSPPLLYGATHGSTPFRLSLHVSDLGHFAIFGPPGAGKSTLLNLLIAQHFRYPDAQVFGFDFGYSMFTLCEASGGMHYDIAGSSKIGFCPLAQIDTPADRTWAAEFIELLVTLRLGKDEYLSVPQQNEIARAIAAMAADTKHSTERTITHFTGTVQDNKIKEALMGYTVGSGAIGDMLDAESDALVDTAGQSKFFIFEMSHLFALGDKAIIPVMMHIFRQIEKRVAKSIPTLIPIDEAFRSFGHPLAIARLNQWLEVMRKENAAVGFATQNIDTVLKSSIGSSILQTTATKFLLPNPEAATQNIKPLYLSLGLNDRQINNLSMARPKRDYYVMNADGRRMFDLGLGQVALAFVGVSGKEQMQEVRELKGLHGDEWVCHWFQARGVPQDWGNYWLRMKKEMKR